MFHALLAGLETGQPRQQANNAVNRGRKENLLWLVRLLGEWIVWTGTEELR